MTTLYIAGPMTGLPELNFPAFHAEADRLRAMGFEVVNPAEINPDKHMTWQACMRTDIAALVFCDGIHLLPGWRNSKGATLEHDIALRLGLSITYPEGEGAPKDEAEQLRKALRFYANAWHFTLSEPEAWDTVSGEPPNYWCDEAGTATVENGGIAVLALSGAEINWEDEEPPSIQQEGAFGIKGVM